MSAKHKLVGLSLCLACGLFAAAGCAPQGATSGDGNESAENPNSQSSTTATTEEREYTDEQKAVIAGEEGATTYDAIDAEAFPGKDYIDQLYDKWADIAVEYAPEIRTLPDGRMVQRTPTEYQIEAGTWQTQAETNSYNTYWLDADSKGCLSCHVDLSTLIKNLAFEHPTVWNDELSNQLTVQECIDCHRYAPGYISISQDFGTLMHSVHYGSRHKAEFEDTYDGGCMSCHNATENGNDMEIWDLVKYDHLWGLVDIASEDLTDAEFSWEQETVQSDVFSFEWMHGYYCQMRHGSEIEGLDLPQSLFDSWEITIEGNVNEPYTALLKDLVAEAEQEGVVITKNSKLVCNWNMVGGGGISNANITGIPISWLIEKAGGYTDDSNGVRVMRADGTSKRSFSLEKLNSDQALLVYKMDGEYLGAKQGYPCTNWVEGVDAQVCSKQVDRYVVSSDCPDFTDWQYMFDKHDGSPNGWFDENGVIVNRPNATILDVPEGLIIETGQPYTFHGYADAYNEEIDYLEFSFDKGETWTRYEVDGSDVTKVLWWSLTWTPPEHGAYTVTVRAATVEGSTSTQTHTVMVNAKDEMPSAEDTVVYETAGLVKVDAATDAQ